MAGATSPATERLIQSLINPSNSEYIGSVDQAELYRHVAADCMVFFLWLDGVMACYTVTELQKDPGTGKLIMREVNNILRVKGMATAMMVGMASYGYPVIILPDEPLTRSGLNWIRSLIADRRGVVPRDLEGNRIDPDKLEAEWIAAGERTTSTPGPTGIVFEGAERSLTEEYFQPDPIAEGKLLYRFHHFLTRETI